MTRSVNAPPNKGPTIAPSPNITPTAAEKMGRLCNGTACATTTNDPVKMPALPHPAIALPIMSATEPGATPQMRLPSSKMPKAQRKDHFKLNMMNTRPYMGWRAPAVKRYALPYQPTSPEEWKSSVMRGIALKERGIN